MRAFKALVWLTVVILTAFTCITLLILFFEGPKENLKFVGSSLDVFVIWGLAWALLSLLLAKPFAKWAFRVKILNGRNVGAKENHLLEYLELVSQAAGLLRTPQIGIYESSELNAFSVGPTRNRSLIAISRGLLNVMDNDSLEGVLGHEIAHIASGDMLTMTLLMGAINGYSLFLLHLFRGPMRESRGRFEVMVFAILDILAQVLALIMGMMIVGFFSRLREFRGDLGGARLVGKEKMLGALDVLQKFDGLDGEQSRMFQTSKICGLGMFQVVTTHPAIGRRIRRLRALEVYKMRRGV